MTLAECRKSKSRGKDLQRLGGGGELSKNLLSAGRLAPTEPRI